MCNAFARILCAACLPLVPTTANAKDWVTLDYRTDVGGYWVDRDSITQSGDVMYFDSSPHLSHSQTPDDATRVNRRAYNCRTATLYNVSNGSLVDGVRLTTSESAYPYLYVLCFANRR